MRLYQWKIEKKQENILFGVFDAKEIVIQFIFDDGFIKRGQTENILFCVFDAKEILIQFIFDDGFIKRRHKENIFRDK